MDFIFWSFNTSKKIAPFLPNFNSASVIEGRQQWKSVIMVVIPSVWRMIAVDFCLFETTICHYFGLFSFNVCTVKHMFKGLLFSWGFGTLGTLSCPSPISLKELCLKKFSSELSLEAAKAGFIGNAKVPNFRITSFT